MTGRYCSRNLSWKWGSLGQDEGYFQLTWSRRGAKGIGSTTNPSGGSGLTAREMTESPHHTRLPHRGELGSPLPPRAGCPGDIQTWGKQTGGQGLTDGLHGDIEEAEAGSQRVNLSDVQAVGAPEL